MAQAGLLEEAGPVFVDVDFDESFGAAADGLDGFEAEVHVGGAEFAF